MNMKRKNMYVFYRYTLITNQIQKKYSWQLQPSSDTKHFAFPLLLAELRPAEKLAKSRGKCEVVSIRRQLLMPAKVEIP